MVVSYHYFVIFAEFLGDGLNVDAEQLGHCFLRQPKCLDNAMMENFFGVMKSELLYQGNYTSADEFKKDLVEYIDYYNNDRIKLRLGGMSPVKYRLMHTVSNNV